MARGQDWPAALEAIGTALSLSRQAPERRHLLGRIAAMQVAIG